VSLTLVVGAGGFVGSCYADHVERDGHRVVRAGRRRGLDVVLSTSDRLDAVLAEHEPDQIVVTAQLADPATGWLLERIDGPRWLVLSSAQLASSVPGPGHRQALIHERLARSRGAVVLRPTMIFGRGRDLNITRLLRQIARLGFATQFGGSQLVQPLHIDDLSVLMEQHLANPSTQVAGDLFDVGGREQLPVAELLDCLEQLAGAAGPRLVLPAAALVVIARAASLGGLRSDQVARLIEDKVVDITKVCELFGWQPEFLPLRLEQAYSEAEIK